MDDDTAPPRRPDGGGPSSQSSRGPCGPADTQDDQLVGRSHGALPLPVVSGSDDGTGNWKDSGDGGDGSTVADAKTRYREGVDANVSDGHEEDDHDAVSESDAGNSICSDD
jgi:hypothetical protein